MQPNDHWWRGGVIYQIYPRSFNDFSGDGLGDLKGITARLDYLSDLGVDAIWLSPIYPSPDVDFGYDVSDYQAVDPRFGSLADFDTLLEAAHSRGIRVILDLVLNHTSNQHPWFLQSRQSKDNPYHDWYLWRDPHPGGGPPNNWASWFGGQGWEFVPELNQYYFHTFYKQQPELNWRNPDARQALLGVFRFWLERGVDGFRLDVFNAYLKHPNLPDNPRKIGLRSFDRLRHFHDFSHPDLLPLLAEIRQIVDSYPDRYLVGEPFHVSIPNAANYCGDDHLHAIFNFKFLRSRWRPKEFLTAVLEWERALEQKGWPTYVLNNHDNPRSSTRYRAAENDERLKVAAALLLTLRGTPFLYYGEEIGLRDIHRARGETLDPVGRTYWPLYKGRDGCRGAMQWDDTPNAGFTTGTPWLPPNPDYPLRNVAAQQQDPDSLLNFYRQLIQLRRLLPALRQGMFLPLTYEPRAVLAYLRQTSQQTVLVALNFSKHRHKLVLGPELAQHGWKLLLSNFREDLEPLHAGLLPLEGDEVCILLQV